jgi:hypothetical protein
MNKLLIAALSLLISGCAAINPNYAAQDDRLDLLWQKEYHANRQACLDAELLVSNLGRKIDERAYSLPNGEVCHHEIV